MDNYYEAYDGYGEIKNNDYSYDKCSCEQKSYNEIPEITSCCGEVEATTEPTCKAEPVMPKVVPPGHIVTKIPVVLAEVMIPIHVMADITLQNPAIEIKRIRKNVYVTQCKVIPQFEDGYTSKMGILFIEGFIRKNIEYATKSCTADGVISGNIQHTTAKVPFRCTTPIYFNRPPVLKRNFAPLELEYFEDTLKQCDVCAEPVIGREPCEQDFFNIEHFNEKIFCELVKADIIEADFHKNPRPVEGKEFRENPTEQMFHKIREKVMITLTLKILQKQQVRVQSLGPVTPPPCGCEDPR